VTLPERYLHCTLLFLCLLIPYLGGAGGLSTSSIPTRSYGSAIGGLNTRPARAFVRVWVGWLTPSPDSRQGSQAVGT